MLPLFSKSTSCVPEVLNHLLQVSTSSYEGSGASSSFFHGFSRYPMKCSFMVFVEYPFFTLHISGGSSEYPLWIRVQKEGSLGLVMMTITCVLGVALYEGRKKVLVTLSVPGFLMLRI